MYITDFIEYLEMEKNYSPHTLLAYKKDVEAFAEFMDKPKISNLEYRDIRSWIVNLVEEGISNRSINRKVASLKAYYNYLVKLQYIETNPLVYHQALKTESKLQLPFSHIEMEKAFDTMEKQVEEADDFESLRNLLIVSLLYASGMRRAELITIDIKDIDLSQKQILVKGKGAKVRLLPLLPWLVDLIKEYLHERKELDSIEDKEAFLLTVKGKRIYPTLIYRVVNSLFKQITGKQTTSPHILRHTFATHLLDEGADLLSIKDLLGHASLDSTQVYVHNSLEKIQRVYTMMHPRSKKK